MNNCLAKFWVALACAGIWAAAGADVVINEVQSSNNGTLLDDDGDASDWIELLNLGAQGVSLEGWGLSDRASNPMKWVLPDVTLGAGQRRLIFASGKDRTNVQEVALGSPQDVPGLVLWLRAESLQLGNGASVSAWDDLSGLGNHATQASSSARPTFAANAVNGRPAVRFTRSSSQQLLLPASGFSGLDTLRDFSVFIVCRWGGQGSSGIFGAYKPGASNAHFEVENSGGQLRFRVADMNSIQSSGTMTVNAWCQVAGLMNSSGDTPIAKMFRDGVLRGERTQNPGSAVLSNYTNLMIGNSDSDRYFGGDIAEVLMFNRALSSRERVAVERLLAARYGLPSPGGAVEPELHANFSLSASGETLVLTQPGGAAADLVQVPPLPEGSSYGRSPDGDLVGFAYFAVPTPNAPNTTTPYGPPIAPPSFSHERGIYDTPFNLTLSAGDPAASVYYTLDGAEPSTATGTLYAAPVAVTNTTVVRAIAWKAGALPASGGIVTHTYLFLDSVMTQTNRPAGYPADWHGFTQTSYGISPYLASQPGHEQALREALLAAPVVAISASVDDLFGSGGVYSNPTVDGLERGVSVEWLTNGVSQLQINAGLRAQGGASREFGNTPKKSLRLLFKSAYGDGRLREPVLAAGGTALADFNTLILRAEYNNAWTHTDSGQRPRGVYVRDQWVRDAQIQMSGNGSHGSHVHLFLNGLYWGIYNIAERPDAAFAATTFGGKREDYDAMTIDGIRDGNNVAWNTLHALAKAGLTTPSQYEGIAAYLDVDHLIDYMILNFYAGNNDWPHHNWNSVRLRKPGAGYLFYVWDAERTLEGANDNCTGATFTSGPAYLHTALRANPEYCLRFADRIHRSLFNDGALTPANAAASFAVLADTVEPLMYGEAARWGAYRNEVTSGGSIKRYGVSDWTTERDRLLTVWFPSRTANMLAQFRSAGLYPTLAAPEFSQHGGTVAQGAAVSIAAAQGTIYVTFDGTDPRVAYTGAISANAAAYAAPFAVPAAVTVKARALLSGQWSALTEAAFSPPPPDYAALRVAEFMYAPSAGDDYAWIDLINTSAGPLDISGITFVPTGAEDPAVEWTAPQNLIMPSGGHIILARDPTTLTAHNTVPGGTPVLQYKKNFARKGEPVTFADPSGTPFFSFTYSHTWYPETYNSRLSLVAVDFLAPEPLWSTPANWRPSAILDGTPGYSETPRVKTFAVTPSALQEGILTFPAEGLEWGFKVMWSIDLADWHDCPPVSVILANGTVHVTLPSAALTANRCFFKIVNP